MAQFFSPGLSKGVLLLTSSETSRMFLSTEREPCSTSPPPSPPPCDTLAWPQLVQLTLTFNTLSQYGSGLAVKSMIHIVFLLALLGGVLTAPFVNEEQAKRFIRQKRQAGYWDPNHSQNMWGFTIQEQANEYWTALRTDAQYYMDMSRLMFDRSVADENSRLYLEMLRQTRAHLDAQTGRRR